MGFAINLAGAARHMEVLPEGYASVMEAIEQSEALKWSIDTARV